MANRKKLRRRFMNGEVKYDQLSEDERKYIDKFARKIERDMTIGSDLVIPTYKEVPCQKWNGKTALVPATCNVVTGEDGLLYVEEEDPKNLIVSTNWLQRQASLRAEASRARQKVAKAQQQETEKAVTDLKPIVLGE